MTPNSTPDQPDGIADDSHDLPAPERAAHRITEFLTAYGDGLIEPVVAPEYEGTTPPLYARDLQVLANQATLEYLQQWAVNVTELFPAEVDPDTDSLSDAIATVVWLHAEAVWHYNRQHDELHEELDKARVEVARLRAQPSTAGQDVTEQASRVLASRFGFRLQPAVKALADAGLLRGPVPEPARCIGGHAGACPSNYCIPAGSLAEPTGRTWRGGDPEPVAAWQNTPRVRDRYGVEWVGAEREDGFEGWGSDSHGLHLLITWDRLTAQRGPIVEAGSVPATPTDEIELGSIVVSTCIDIRNGVPVFGRLRQIEDRTAYVGRLAACVGDGSTDELYVCRVPVISLSVVARPASSETTPEEGQHG